MANEKEIKKNVPVNFDEDTFGEDDIPESNWFKFMKVGDKVSGILVEIEMERQSNDPKMANQRVFTLKTASGDIINVGIAMTKDYIIQRTNSIDMEKYDYKIQFEFKKEVPSTKGKNYAAAKSIEVYIKKREKATPAI